MTRTRHILGLLTVMLLGMGLASGAEAQTPAYYNAAWQYRRPITLDSTASVITLPGFTSAVTLTSANFNFAHAKSDGSDIRVCDTDGVTPLPFYLAAFNAAAQTGTLYVKKSLQAGTWQTLYLYSGNPSAASVSSFGAAMTKPVVLADTLCLLHLDDGTGTTAADATGTYPATLVGGATWGSDVAFPTGSQVVLNGTTGYVNVPNVLSTWPSAGSASLWFTPSTAWPTGSSDVRLFGKTNVAYTASPLSGECLDCYLSASTGKLTLRVQKAGVNYSVTSTASSFAAGAAHHVAVTWRDGQGFTLYLDGAAQGSPLVVGVPASGNAAPLTVGAYASTSSTVANYFPGSIDEVQITGGAGTPGIYRLPRLAADIAHTSYDPNWEGAKWSKQGTILAPSAPLENKALQEPSVVYDGTQFVMWYSGGWGNEYTFRATSPDGVHWTKYSATPVLGNGQGGESGAASCNSVYYEAGTYYLYYCNGSPFQSAQQLATSPDGINWTKQPSPAAIPPWSTPNGGLTNSALVKAGSTYTLITEASENNGAIYLMGRETASSPLGPFTDVLGGPVASLVRGGASATDGGPWIQTLGAAGNAGYYQMWHHAGLTGNSPTDIYRDFSPDLATWTHYSSNDPVLSRGGSDTGDQVADPSVLSLNGKSFLWYASVTNPSQSSFLALATYNGTLAQLTQDGSPVTVGGEAAFAYALTGPAALASGNPAAVTLSASMLGSAGDVITYSDNLTTHGTFSPATQTVAGSGTSTVVYTPPAGYTGPVTLSAAGAAGSAALTVPVAAAAATGTKRKVQ